MSVGCDLIQISRMERSKMVIMIICGFWLTTAMAQEVTRCRGSELGLRHLWGDALTDPPDCIGPNGLPYPKAAVARAFRNVWSSNSRTGRSGLKTMDPAITQRALLETYRRNNEAGDSFTSQRAGRAASQSDDICKGSGAPSRMCKTRYNTTAPMYGVSLTSGQPVTIVQKFPDLLQQVVFEVCESSDCDVVHGVCTQTYVPYLFLVIPLGPVTLTGQDYVLVESGCVCKPKYASKYAAEANAISAIP
ncbi:uncharacterized protein LOC143910703 [Arctopsyche grandis]|uniref:uncharacterized protein LOC143910703 n=1 Tax=Arctopsyche grandis TaxID=121162 RepID=UPI00406D6DAA